MTWANLPYRWLKGVVSGDGTLCNIEARWERHFGSPIDTFRKYYKEICHGSISCIVTTGTFSSRLKNSIISKVPEEIVKKIATGRLCPDQYPIKLLEIGLFILYRDSSHRSPKLPALARAQAIIQLKYPG